MAQAQTRARNGIRKIEFSAKNFAELREGRRRSRPAKRKFVGDIPHSAADGSLGSEEPTRTWEPFLLSEGYATTFCSPTGESQRLEALHAYGILDTPTEASFEHITSLATRLFRVPIAAVTLVDAERQWFKSVRGLEVRETARDVSFCALAMLDEDVFTVPDTHLDSRFANNPLTQGEKGWRFYAGAPLRTPEGHPLGALALADHEPRKFGPSEKQALKELAALVQDELLLRRVSRELAAVTASVPPPEQISTTRDGAIPALEAGETPFVGGSESGLEHHSRQLIEEASDAIVLHDLDGHFLDVNKAACTLMGYRREELLGLKVGDISPTINLEESAKRWRVMGAGESITIEGTNRRKDGSLFPAEARISVLETPRGRLVLALVRDLSERKRAEEILHVRAQQQQAIAKLGTEALRGRGLDSLFEEVTHVVGETLKLDLCGVLEFLPERNEFAVRAWLGAPATERGLGVVPDGPQYAPSQVLRTGEPVIIKNFDTDAGFKTHPVVGRWKGNERHDRGHRRLRERLAPIWDAGRVQPGGARVHRRRRLFCPSGGQHDGGSHRAAAE